MSDILVIEDDPAVGKLISKTLGGLRHAVYNAYTLEEGLDLARARPFAVIFQDIYLPDGNGLEAVADLIDLPYQPEIVIITGQRESNEIRLAFDKGVFDYLKKPFGLDEIRLTCNRAIEFRASRIQTPHSNAIDRDGIIGESSLMKVGHEKGAFTGAETRREGLVALADQGTLFLDEIGELNSEAQKRFLRLLEEKRFYPLGSKRERYSDFRLVAATNRDLFQMSRRGEFRTDLYYRICGQEISLPPLRDRPEDIRNLVYYYADKICSRMQIPVKRVYSELLEALVGFPAERFYLYFSRLCTS